MRAVRGYDNYNCERSEMAINGSTGLTTSGSAAMGENVEDLIADKFDQLKMEILARVVEARRRAYEEGLKKGIDTGWNACKKVDEGGVC